MKHHAASLYHVESDSQGKGHKVNNVELPWQQRDQIWKLYLDFVRVND